MSLVKETHLLVDGDPLTYRFGIADNPQDAWLNLTRYLRDIEIATGASKTTIFLTKGDCVKMYRFHVARLQAYQGNRTGKAPYLPSRKLLAQRLLQEGAISDPLREADDLLVDASRNDPQGTIILSPDKDLRQAPGPLWASDYSPPFPGHWALSQLLQGDRADNIPSLVKGMGPKKAEKFLMPFKALREAQEAIIELAKGDTLRVAELSSLSLLGGSPEPWLRVKEFWGDLIPQEDLNELQRRCEE